MQPPRSVIPACSCTRRAGTRRAASAPAHSNGRDDIDSRIPRMGLPEARRGARHRQLLRGVSVTSPVRATTAAIELAARRLGFDLVGIAPAVTPAGIHNFLDWLDRGFAGDMDYLPRREA